MAKKAKKRLRHRKIHGYDIWVPRLVYKRSELKPGVRVRNIRSKRVGVVCGRPNTYYVQVVTAKKTRHGARVVGWALDNLKILRGK